MTPGWTMGRLRAGRAEDGIVLKLGGSLLAHPRWPRLVAALVADQPVPPTIVVGGGSLVDALRRIDAVSPQPAAVMHDLAIATMDVTARLVSRALDIPLSDRPATGHTIVLRAGAWLAIDGGGDQLPHDWSVTSDSIAATVAAARNATLILAKSVPPAGDDLDRLAADGWIDRHFPLAARSLPTIGWAAPAPG